MVQNTKVAMSGLRKAAILTTLLGEDCVSTLFKFLREEEIERIVGEMASLSAISRHTGEEVLEEFHEMATASGYISAGGVDYTQRLLTRALGPDTARQMMERVAQTFKATAGFASLAKADPQQLSKFILNEQPQTIALILAHLQAAHGAQLISLLPEVLRADVVTRMASLDEVSPDVVSRISSVIEQRLKNLGGSSLTSFGGLKSVAELLNRLDRSVAQSILEGIEADLPDLAVSIRNLMFVFDDLLHVDDTAMREIIQRADRRSLTLALKGASEEMRAHFFHNMSKRAADLLREEMEVLGAVRLREVEKAQQEIVAIARKLEEEGLLVTGAAAGEAYVA